MAFSTLSVDLVAKVAGFEEGMNKAARSLQNLDSRASSTARNLKSAFGALGATLSVGAIASFAKSGIDAADALNDMSKRTGVAVKDLASFQLIAEQSGTSLDSVAVAISKLSLSVGQAQNSNKEMAGSLTRLGITATEPKERFLQLADAIEKNGLTTQTLADLQKVLGKAYAETLPLLLEGSEAIRSSAKASESFAESMAKLAPNADKFNDNLSRMKYNAAGAAASILGSLVPALNELYEKYSRIRTVQERAGGFLKNLGVTGDAATDLRNVNTELKKTQETLAKSTANGIASKERLSDLSIEIERLKEKKKAILEYQAAQALEMGKPYADYKVPKVPLPDQGDIAAQLACISNDGIWDGKKCVQKKAKAKTAKKEKIVDYDSLHRMAGQDEFDHYRETLKAVTEEQNAWNAHVKESRQELTDMVEPSASLVRELVRLDQFDGVLDPELLAAARLEINAQIDSLGKMAPALEKTKSLAEDVGLVFASAFEDAIASGESFRDMLKGLLQDLLKLVARKAVTEPLVKFVTGMFADSANGNVFAGPGISAYSGSVVSQPTIFPFANGIGLMGEAGKEAVLPLKRGKNGKLGVSLEGDSGVQVNNYYTIDARGADVGAEQRIRRAIADSENRAVARSVSQVQNLNQRGQLRLS